MIDSGIDVGGSLVTRRSVQMVASAASLPTGLPTQVARAAIWQRSLPQKQHR